VWHGSPHKFDRFDASKIGTGEGAQAYGHGLYLAENPAVAAGYKETLSSRARDRLTIDGRAIDTDSMFGRAAEDIPRIGLKATLQKIEDNIRFNEKYAPDIAELYRGVKQQISSLDPSRVALKEGSLYKVDLPDDQIAKMLDYDKPIKDQASILEIIRSSLPQDMLSTFDANAKGGISGANAYKNWLWNGGKTEASKAEAMRQAGIPGIRYLDGGSRGAGSGSSNFVVFPGNEGLLNILERNGQPIR
jgi:hypothetical protein